MTQPILTDGNGRPFEKPLPPADDAPIEEKIAWIRATHDYNDRVTDCANQAFADAFSKAIRKPKREDTP